MASALSQLDALAGRTAGNTPAAKSPAATSALSALDQLAGRPTPQAPATPPPAPKPKTGLLETIYDTAKSGIDSADKAVGGAITSLFEPKKQAAAPAPDTSALQALDKMRAPAPKTPTLDALDTKAQAAPGADTKDFPMPKQDLGMADSTQPVADSFDPDPIGSLKTVLQALPRDMARIGVSLGQAGLNLASPELGKKSDISIQPTGLMKYLIGDAPVTGLADSAADYERAVKNSDFAKKYGFDKYATALGVLGATTPVGLDFLGAGGEASAVTALAKSTDIVEISKILRQVGVHEDLVLPLAQHIAKTSSEAAIRDALKTAEALQKTTTRVAPKDTETALHAPAAGAKAADLTARGAAEEVAPAEIKAAEAAARAETPAEAGTKAGVQTIAQAMKAAAPAAETRSASALEKDLASLIEYQSFMKDTLSNMPGRDLMRYRSSATGDLPNIEAGSKSKFGKRGDTMMQEILGQDASGNGDIDIANQHLQEYLHTRDQARAIDEEVKSLRASLKAARRAEQEANKARKAADRQAARRVSKGPARATQPAAPVRSEAMGSQSTGDYLRRGAERVVGGQKPLPANIPRGVASDQAQRAAVLQTVAGDIEKGPFKGFSTQVKNWYQDWIFARQAAPVETKLALKPFESLKGEGMDWIDEYTGARTPEELAAGAVQVSDRTGVKAEVERLLNQWLSEEQAVGIKVAEKANYFPIYLKDLAAGEAEDTLGARRLGIKPSFSLQSQFKDYAEARAAGYEPKYTNAFDILKARAKAHFKAMADANMFHTGIRNGWIVPEQAVSPDLRPEFRVLDPNSFPHMAAAYGNTVNVRNYSAPTALAEKIDTYLRKPNVGLKKVADVASTLKNTALSVGIPGTGVSVHFWNVLPREAGLSLGLSPATAPYQIAKYFYYGVNPRAASRYIEKNLPRALPLIRAGMKFSTEDHNLGDSMLAAFKKVVRSDGKEMYVESTGSRLGKAGKALSDTLHKIFGGNTFDKLLPARKLENGLKLLDFYTKRGLSMDEAARLAADDMNTVYGGINWEALGRDRNLQNGMRAALMASDFAETNIRLGSRMVKAFANPKSPQAELYRRMAYAFLGTLGVANLINYENTGHTMVGNDILHQFSLDLGKSPNGKERYFNLFGTGADFARIPLEIATAVAKGNYGDLNSIVRNRLSIPFASAFSLIENVDWKGSPILGPDKYGQPQTGAQQAQNVFDNTIGNVLPGSIQPVGQLMAGKETVPQFATQAAGLPISYKNITPNTTDINALKAKAASGIKNGDYRLFNQLVKAGAIPARTKAAFIRTALQGKSARAQKAAAKAKAKTKTVEQNLLQQGFTSSD